MKTKLILCRNKEFIREMCGVDFSAVHEFDLDDAVEFYAENLISELDESGFELSISHWGFNRWNGAYFPFKYGNIACWETITQEKEKDIKIATQEAESKLYAQYNAYSGNVEGGEL